MLMRQLGITVLIAVLYNFAFAGEREIAITIDDLPFVGSGTSTPSNLKRTQERFMAIVNTLTENDIPATGFAIGGAIGRNEWELLEIFKNKGFALGNHTYTHRSLNGMSAEQYINDVERADNKLIPVMTHPKYFRYPYLAEGTGEKKQKVHQWLFEHQYTVAPVTIDSKDYEFNAQYYKVPYRQRAANLNRFKSRYLSYIWQQTLKAEQRSHKKGEPAAKQILLIHANLLNSLLLPDIIELYKKNGYKFISLEEALRNNVAPTINSLNTTTFVLPKIKHYLSS